MSGYIAPSGKFLAEENGEPLVGAKLYTYQAGTTNPLPTYTISDLSVANTNPVVMDSQGRATIFLNSALSYDFVLKRSDDSTVWTVSGIVAMATGADLAAESASRAAADTTEANARIAADSAEASARAAADTTLQNNINAINNRARGAVYGGATLQSGAFVTPPAVGFVSVGSTPDAGNTAGIYTAIDGKFIANAAGWWRFTFNIDTTVISTGAAGWTVKHNGTAIANATGSTNIVGNNGRTISVLRPMALNDYIQLEGSIAVAGDKVTMSGATFQFLGS